MGFGRKEKISPRIRGKHSVGDSSIDFILGSPPPMRETQIKDPIKSAFCRCLSSENISFYIDYGRKEQELEFDDSSDSCQKLRYKPHRKIPWNSYPISSLIPFNTYSAHGIAIELPHILYSVLSLRGFLSHFLIWLSLLGFFA